MPPKQEMVIPHLPLCSLAYSGGTLMVTAAPKLKIQMKDECISPFRNPLIRRFYNNVVSLYLMSIFMYFFIAFYCLVMIIQLSCLLFLFPTFIF